MLTQALPFLDEYMIRLLDPFDGLYEHEFRVTGRDVTVTIRPVGSSPSIICQATASAAPDGTIDRGNPLTWLDSAVRREAFMKLRAAYLGLIDVQ